MKRLKQMTLTELLDSIIHNHRHEMEPTESKSRKCNCDFHRAEALCRKISNTKRDLVRESKWGYKPDPHKLRRILDWTREHDTLLMESISCSCPKHSLFESIMQMFEVPEIKDPTCGGYFTEEEANILTA
jgi:hypothetical protein